MSIVLHIESPGQPLRQMNLCESQIFIGSANTREQKLRAGLFVPLHFPTVSKLHASVRLANNVVYFTDLKSRNGSYLDGTKLASEQETAWPQKSKIGIGPFWLSWKKKNPVQTPPDPLEKLRDAYLLFGDQENASSDLSQIAASLNLSADQMEHIKQECFGDGPLQAYLQNENCKDLLINQWNEIFADLGDGLRPVSASFICAQSYLAWARRKAHECQRRLDLQNPICEAWLASGARFHAVLNPVSKKGLSVSIRKFGSAPFDETTALQSGWMDARALGLLRQAVQSKLNIIISGGTSSGKTSLLNFLCRYFEKNERILTIEDTAELLLPVTNWVSLVSRPPNTEGHGEITLRQLLQSALRMRPDRIVVGECRGAEVIDMLQALNTGHPGSLTTVHANSAAQALQRLELMTLLASPTALSPKTAQKWIGSSVQMIVHLERSAKGVRFVHEIAFLEKKGLQNAYRRKV